MKAILFTLITISVFAKPIPHRERKGRETKPEVPGVYANPVPVAPAPKLDQSDFSDPHQRELAELLNHPPYQEWINKKIKALGGKETVTQMVERWHTEFPGITVTELALNLAALEIGGAGALGRMNPKLCSVMTPYAQAMANENAHNAHRGVEGRWEITKHFEEVVGTTPPAYRNDHSIIQAARDCFSNPERAMMINGIKTTYEESGWRTSPPHWGAISNPRQKSFCYDMRLGTAGAYACAGAFSRSE